MIKNYLKIAWRNIAKHKSFSFINVGGLALGMASCLLLILYVTYHLGFDQQFNHIDQVYLIESNQAGDGKIFTFPVAPRPLADALQTQVPGVARAVRTSGYSAAGLITYKDNSFKKDGLYADQGFFSIFSYPFIKGNASAALSRVNSIVITQNLAGVLFGSTDPMGKMVKLNNKTELMVTGIIENIPPNSSQQFDYIMPWTLFESENAWVKNMGWSSNICQTIVQLKNGADFNRADHIVRQMINKNQKDYKAEAMLFPFAKSHLYSKFENGKSVGGLIDQIHLFIWLAICILLIACVNFMNLSTARSEERAKEVGIRKAIGAGRKMLIVQFITESVILSCISLVIAVILLELGIPFFNHLLNIQLALPYNAWYAWLLLFAFAMGTGLISGSYPAFYLSSFKPVKVLKGVLKTGSSILTVRKVLVVVQFAFAVFLITATICIYKQLLFIQSKPIGYDRNNLVEVKVEGSLLNKSAVLINELKKDNLITNATSLQHSITVSYNNSWGISWPGKPVDERILFDVYSVGYDFIRTTGVKIVQGREFSNQYPADTAGKTIMVNEAAAKVMNLKQPVGTIITNGRPVTIVGVFKDFVMGSPYKKTPPMICYCSNNGDVIAMRLNAGKSISACMDGINTNLKAINPSYPPVIKFVDDNFKKKFENEKVLATLANLFGGLAIIISCLGLFGLAAYAAEQRTKEIGVRKVLGASVSNLTALLSKDFLQLVFIAIIITVPIAAWTLNKWLENYDYKIDLSWWVFALAGFTTIIIALATVSYQAAKAALMNPVKSLRSE